MGEARRVSQKGCDFSGKIRVAKLLYSGGSGKHRSRRRAPMALQAIIGVTLAGLFLNAAAYRASGRQRPNALTA